MIRIAPLAAAVLLAACSQQGTGQAGAEAAASAAPDAAALSTIAAASPVSSGVATDPANVSQYTSLRDCKVVESNEDEDWSVSRCSGLAGYDLLINYGDARESIAVLKQGKELAELNLWLRGGGGFNAVGDKAEWRGVVRGTVFEPRTLIVRNTVFPDPDKPERGEGQLEVFDLAKACTIATVKPQPNQNEKARAIADQPTRNCPVQGG